MRINIKKLDPKAVIPTKGTTGSAGFDLTAIDIKCDACGNIVYYTGISIELPPNYVGLIFPRSSISKKDLTISNCVGVIDSDYRGEILVKCKPVSIVFTSANRRNGEGELVECYRTSPVCTYHTYKAGDRIAQLVIMKLPEIEFDIADTLSNTLRGSGGYGSTGN